MTVVTEPQVSGEDLTVEFGEELVGYVDLRASKTVGERLGIFLPILVGLILVAGWSMLLWMMGVLFSGVVESTALRVAMLIGWGIVMTVLLLIVMAPQRRAQQEG